MPQNKGMSVVNKVLGSLRGRWLWVCTIAAIALSRFFWYGIQQPYIIYPDSTQYITFDTSAVLQGNLRAAEGRAPLYGIFLDLMGFFFGESYLDAAKFVQVLASLLSICIFARLLYKIGIRSPWRELCVFLYAVTPAVVGWDTAILTESFSLSGTVLFFYLVVSYIQEHRLRYGVLSLCLATALAFLRPQFLAYLALLLVFLILKWFFPFERKERRTILALLLLQVVLWSGVLGYCELFRRNTGVFSLAVTLPVQNLRLCIDRGYYEGFDDAEMAEYISSRMDAGEEALDVCNGALGKFGFARCGATAKQYLSSHPLQNISDTMEIILNSMQEQFCAYPLYRSKLNPNARGIFFKVYPLQMGLFGFVTIAHALLMSLLSGVAMVIVWVRRRTLPWLHMALFSITMCTTFLTYFVTCGEYMRTMVSVVPYLYCMGAMFLQMCADGLAVQPKEQAKAPSLFSR